MRFTPVRQWRCVAVDLAPYSLAQPWPVKQAVPGALDELDLEGVLRPNYIDYSGNGIDRGAYLQWLIEPRDAEDGL